MEIREKTGSGRFYEDFALGAVLEHAVPRTLTSGDHAVYLSLTGDRHPLHCNAEFARALGLRRECLPDLLVFHTVFGQSVADVSFNAVANLGYADVRFLAPVYEGDTLGARSEVVGKKENSDGKTGNVYVHTTGRNQRGEAVLRFFRWVMVRKRLPGASGGEKVLPDLPASIAPASLRRDFSLDLRRFDHKVTGGNWFFEDYQPGERIAHAGGITMEEADHMSATRLYQNGAKVHFNAQQMADTPGGKRLIYGGHVISTAWALAFSGLENVLGMLGWNGGSHANPCFAGDTVYAFSDVLDKAEVPDQPGAGALRLRLCATKNLDPERQRIAIRITDEKRGGERYASELLLDLDLWALIPKKP